MSVPTPKSRKSASSSKPVRNKRRRVSLRRTLKRGAEARAIEDDDWKWLFAAYHKGCFREYLENFRENFGIKQELPDDPDGKDFQTFMTVAMATVPHWWVLTADWRGRGVEPVGLVAAAFQEAYLAPHVEWFPWATHRSKVETTVRFLADINKMERVIIFTRASELEFWRLMGNYGLLRRRSPPLPGWFGDSDADIWVSP